VFILIFLASGLQACFVPHRSDLPDKQLKMRLKAEGSFEFTHLPKEPIKATAKQIKES